MKCIFAATPYHFTVQYHAYALVASHADKVWVMSIDGSPESYRMQPCRDAQGQLDLHCAVFVPSSLGRRAAGRLVTAFNVAHPGVIPPHLTFKFDGALWWFRGRHGLPVRSDYSQI